MIAVGVLFIEGTCDQTCFRPFQNALPFFGGRTLSRVPMSHLKAAQKERTNVENIIARFAGHCKRRIDSGSWVLMHQEAMVRACSCAARRMSARGSNASSMAKSSGC